MYLRHVGRKHPIARGDLTGAAAEFFHDILSPCGHAIVAYDEGRIVGWFRYYKRPGANLCAGGTWVEPEYRDTGLAHQLWARAIARERVKSVYVLTVSTDGRKFVASLLPRYPKLTFEVAA